MLDVCGDRKQHCLSFVAVSSPHDPLSSTSSNPWNMPSLSSGNAPSSQLLYPTIANATNSESSTTVPSTNSALRKTPESFLGDKFINLVDLDKLVTQPKSNIDRHWNSFLSISFFKTRTLLVQPLSVLRIHLPTP